MFTLTCFNEGLKKSLPRILLRSVFSRSGLSCARRLRSSLVQMMKAFRGLLTLCCVEVHLASGLEQLESEFTDSGLEGPELGERTSDICSPSAASTSSHSNIALFSLSWKVAGTRWKCMASDDALDVIFLVMEADGLPICTHPTNRRPGGVDLRCEFQVFSRVSDRPICCPDQRSHETPV